MNNGLYPNGLNHHRSLKFQKLRKLISQNQAKVKIEGLYGSSLSFLLIDIFSSLNTQIFYLSNSKESASYTYTDIVEFLGEDNCNLLPSNYRNYNNKIKDESNVLNRTKTIKDLTEKKAKIIITYPEGIFEKIPNEKAIKDKSLNIKIGQELELGNLNEKLFELNFEKDDYVQEPGDFAIRGNILDIFSYAYTNPIRLEFDGNIIESIREFNIDTQYSVKQLKSAKITPDISNQSLIKTGDSIINIIDQKTLIFVEEIDSIKKKLGDNIINNSNDYSEKLFIKELKEKKLISVNNFDKKADIKFNILQQPAFNKRFEILNENLQKHALNNYKINIYFSNKEQSNRFKQILSKYNYNYEFKSIIKPIYKGFINHDDLKVCYTDHEIFNRFHRYKIQKKYGKNKKVNIEDLNQIKVGDYVTHIDHGVGVYKGLTKIDVEGKRQEVIKLLYGDNDTLYLSIHLFHKISKYKSRDGARPRIFKLGSGAWDRLKLKAKSRIKKLAFDLIKSYAKRKIAKGFKYKIDSSMQNELEAAFLYVDTEDQIKATKDVKADMESDNPMDRLICGDVGFGKTEVAIRAAFKAIDNGMQVAILVPTTILAFQHYKTLIKRFKGFPVAFDYLNRFRTKTEKNKIIDDLNSGKLDLIVGTHQLVSDAIQYKNLGLLIVDEEQKFGVNVKEKIRSIKENIDVLTLTATPIPRTLQYSLMSARDLSIISTAPSNRVPIESEVIRFNAKAIKEAIRFELDRGGQIFFVHNKIDNINEFGKWLENLIPEATIKIAHSKIEGKRLETIMLDFIENKFDVLLSTTIIESGLDVPNANTIFINNSHHFGLSDLHQMRGRVGRSNKRAFCYFITPEISALTSEAKKRIDAIGQYSELGAGFNIAMKDLEIRGAGDLLGGEQSGFINDIGFETYHKILNDAVEELKNNEFKNFFKNKGEKNYFIKDVIIDTDFEILFPNQFVSQVNERLKLYNKLSQLKDENQLEKFRDELKDKYGNIPKESENLLKSIKLKWIAQKLGFEKIVIKREKMLCYFISDNSNSYFDSDVFKNIIKNISKFDDCELKEKNKLYIVFENVKSIDMALLNLNRFQFINN